MFGHIRARPELDICYSIEHVIGQQASSHNHYTNALTYLTRPEQTSELGVKLCAHLQIRMCWNLNSSFPVARGPPRHSATLYPATVLLCYSATLLQCNSATVQLCYSATLYSATVLPCTL